MKNFGKHINSQVEIFRRFVWNVVDFRLKKLVVVFHLIMWCIAFFISQISDFVYKRMIEGVHSNYAVLLIISFS